MARHGLHTRRIHAAYTWCVESWSCPSVTPSSGLLESGPRHGDDLKRAFDESSAEPAAALRAGLLDDVRLLRNGLVEVDGVEAGGGPERKRYAITEAGITDVARWLSQPEKPEPYLQSTLYTKVVLALLTGRGAAELLDVQRAEHLR
ncbi:hypothetical protein SGLAM104S_10487 [Streptomyces glaucescens]